MWSQLYSAGDRLGMLRVVRNADGRLEVFGVAPDDTIWHTWQTAPNNGWVGGWSQLYSAGDALRELDVAVNADGRLEVFGVAPDDTIWHTWQTAPSNGWVGGWSQLYSPGDRLRMLRVVRNADGRLEVFGVAPDDTIWHTWQTAPNNGWVGGWSQLYSAGDALRELDVAVNADGRLEVFGVAPDDTIWHTWQTAPSNGWVGGWSQLYSPGDRLRSLDVTNNDDGRLEVFGVAPDDTIWHTWQTAPNNGWVGGWSQLYSAGDALRELDVAVNADGRLEVFGVAPDDTIWHTWQTAPSNGWVGGWSQLFNPGDRLRSLDVTNNDDGRLEVFGVAPDDTIWHTWQTAPNNGWVTPQPQPSFVRRDVWSLPANPPWDPITEAYALAVGVMQGRATQDPTSWTYQAAMHGTFAAAPPGAQWNLCQHQSWYFFGWHRMYVYYFERIVRAAVVANGGPADFALPYWNYDQAFPGNTLPAPFRAPTLPSGAANPLFLAPPARSTAIAQGFMLSPQATTSANAFALTNFSSPPGGTSFGGGRRTPAQFGGSSGSLEITPHGAVHVQVGGPSAGQCAGGLMGGVNCAALDPIFWLHHANIDRLWEAWLSQGGGRTNPTEAAWLTQSFTFHDETGAAVVLTGADVLDTAAQLGYVYL